MVYREAPDPNAEIERMKKQIESEGKNIVEIPDRIELGDKMVEFQKALKDKSPEDIVLYSKKDGFLRYSGKDTDAEYKIIKKSYFLYYISQSGKSDMCIQTDMDYSNAIYYKHIHRSYE